jgi:two-component system nitrogen regulation response regulator NtrX
MNTVLIVDDLPALREQYAYDLARIGGFRTLVAASSAEALETLQRETVDCVVLDLEMPGMDGFEVLETMRRSGSPVPVIVYTGTGNYDRCVRAVRLGAYGFIDKSEPTERVVREVENALERGRLAREVRSLQHRAGLDTALVGESRAMRTLREQIAKLADIPSPVLILGESGTGKELVARELHRASPRQANPFIALNCAALPENLIESELFGHERGAFTGADRARKGAFESAASGTLFLDEVAELPGVAQAKMLRALEEQKIMRVGSPREIPIDARVIAATHQDLEGRVREGAFREDLLYRLNVHVVRVPPLRERLTDIPLLVPALARRIYERFGWRPQEIAPNAISLLAQQEWSRNNVRELRNAVERMILSAGQGPVEAVHVPPELRDGSRPAGSNSSSPGIAADTGAPSIGASGSHASASSVSGGTSGGSAGATLREQKLEAERRIVLEALERNGWQITRTAEALGLSDHSSLIKIMRRHGLRR